MFYVSDKDDLCSDSCVKFGLKQSQEQSDCVGSCLFLVLTHSASDGEGVCSKINLKGRWDVSANQFIPLFGFLKNTMANKKAVYKVNTSGDSRNSSTGGF